MRKTMIALLLGMLMLAVGSCDRMEEAGDLPGMWQLMSVKRKGVLSDVKDQKVFWSERLGLMQFTSPKTIKTGPYFAYSTIVGDSLMLTDFVSPSQYTHDDDDDEFLTYAQRDVMMQWGIYARKAQADGEKIEAAFRIVAINSEQMMLKSDSSSLIFRKY